MSKDTKPNTTKVTAVAADISLNCDTKAMDTTPNSKPKGQVDVTKSTYVYRDLANVLPSELGDLDEQTSSKYSCHARVPADAVQGDKLPAKLATMLTDPALADIMTWMPHGRSWKVIDREAFCRYALPHYCEHSNYQSFVRIVNAWGFRRIIVGRDRDTYYHEMFLRGKPELHERMKRIPSHHKKAPIEKEHKCPDFYELAKVSPLPEVPLRETSELLVIMQTGAEVTPLGRPKEKKRKRKAGPSKANKRNDTKHPIPRKSTVGNSVKLDETTTELEQSVKPNSPYDETDRCMSHDTTAAKSKSSSPNNDGGIEAVEASLEATFRSNGNAADRESLLRLLFSQKSSQNAPTCETGTSVPSTSAAGAFVDHGSLFRFLGGQKHSQTDQPRHNDANLASSHAATRGVGNESLLQLLLAQNSSQKAQPDQTSTSPQSSRATGANDNHDFLLRCLLAQNSSHDSQPGQTESSLPYSRATETGVDREFLLQLLLAQNSSYNHQPGQTEGAMATYSGAGAGVDQESRFRFLVNQNSTQNDRLATQNQNTSMHRSSVNGVESANNGHGIGFIRQHEEYLRQMTNEDLIKAILAKKSALMASCAAEEPARVATNGLENGRLEAISRSSFPSHSSRNLGERIYSPQSRLDPSARESYATFLPALSNTKMKECFPYPVVQTFGQNAVRDLNREQSRVQHVQPSPGNSFDSFPASFFGARGQAGIDFSSASSLLHKLGIACDKSSPTSPLFSLGPEYTQDMFRRKLDKALERASHSDLLNKVRALTAHNTSGPSSSYVESMDKKQSIHQSQDQNPFRSVRASNIASGKNCDPSSLGSAFSVSSNEEQVARRNIGLSVGNTSYLEGAVQDSPAGHVMVQLRSNQIVENALLNARSSICPGSGVNFPNDSSMNGLPFYGTSLCNEPILSACDNKGDENSRGQNSASLFAALLNGRMK